MSNFVFLMYPLHILNQKGKQAGFQFLMEIATNGFVFFFEEKKGVAEYKQSCLLTNDISIQAFRYDNSNLQQRNIEGMFKLKPI